ncbi:alkaline shock response membrane anchor protein AmaP [Actinopolyspora mortivallis]|uniref:alkaline shock response membrane anchor protein AmaP n=1 Tax=Actinopolyspora mortivallis TaxID=33906 RepID=UPI000378EF08|nr:alkaline shock response membrane anchor protein AmaP [Actinopolyspora mortivallis]
METERANAPRDGGGNSARLLGRTIALERTVTALVGTLALLVGTFVLLVGSGALGTYRARRPLLDPLARRWMTDQPRLTLAAAVVLGIVLIVLGLWWVVRASRPESRPDFRVGEGGDGRISLSGRALAEAIRTDAHEVTGVVGARVRTTGTQRRPGIRMVLSLRDDTDVRGVWEELDHKVLSRARSALQTEVLPTAIRLELDRSREPRVR